MCVDPRTCVRAVALLVCAAVSAGTLACGGGSRPRQEEASETPAAPKVLTAAERAAWHQECWAHFNARAWEQFRACYADTVESEQVDSGQPAARGIEAAMAVNKGFTEAFPDAKGTGELILVNGAAIVSIYVLNGTHTGSLLAPDGQVIPATNRPIGVYLAHHTRADAVGNKVVKEDIYSDTGTMMAQLGLSPTPARPVVTGAAARPAVVLASGTPGELSNVDLLRAQIAAYNSRDAKGAASYNAPDMLYRDLAMPADQTAAESYEGMQAFFKAFPDAKLAATSAWGAGSYVVATGRVEGTNRGAIPAMGVKRPTGKAVSVRYLDITRWEGGKIKEEWIFYDRLAMARQLGLITRTGP
jgi:predicted ester cyclase